MTAGREFHPSTRWPSDFDGKRHAVDAAGVEDAHQRPLAVRSAGLTATPLKY